MLDCLEALLLIIKAPSLPGGHLSPWEERDITGYVN
jgi:hypothetical protein